mmetsp:Transcript_14317/g.45526  ORF Transcript_14317/g.45526 Transcript_14317/m.45526 type:complete len:185 (+) Transcript_14317:73-627(+)
MASRILLGALLGRRVWCAAPPTLGASRAYSSSPPVAGQGAPVGGADLAPEEPGGGIRPMYPSHTPLSAFQKVAVAVGSAAGALYRPARADLVGALGETTGEMAFTRMRDRMRNSEEGRRILRDRPRILESTVGHCWDLPRSTLGGAYAHFMGVRDFSPDDRPPVRFIDDEEVAYVAQRGEQPNP